MKWFYDLSIRTKIIVSFSVLGVLIGALGIYPSTTLCGVSILWCILMAAALCMTVARPLRRMSELAGKANFGDTDGQLQIQSHDEIGILAQSLMQILQTQKEMAQAAMRISRGDFKVEISPKSDNDLLGKGMQLCLRNIQSVDEELIRLLNAAKNGNLSERARTDDFQGAYSVLVRGINEMLDALIRPVNRAIRVMDKVGQRDLTARLSGEYRGDFVMLQNSLNLTIETLEQSLRQVAVAAEQVSSASAQISAGSQMLSRGSSEQAGSIQEVSSTLEEVESVTRQNTEQARVARELSKSAEFAAETGVTNMNRLSEAIGRIKASSDATARIIRTIDEIAFQTNLLALNAAVEAARAGEAGKGFAVVAEEVRNLALRSAEAAKNTAAMIEESVRNSESGVSLNREVLKSLNDINDQVRKVGTVMAGIAAASEQQNQGVAQVNSVVHQMNTVTQQIALNSEEFASGAEELSSQANELKSMVFTFQLSSGPVAGRHSSPYLKKGTETAPRSQHREKAAMMIPFCDSEQQLSSKNQRSRS